MNRVPFRLVEIVERLLPLLSRTVPLLSIVNFRLPLLSRYVVLPRLHDFLRFQIRDRQTGDPFGVQK
jgi:hypothetical protein